MTPRRSSLLLVLFAWLAAAFATLPAPAIAQTWLNRVQAVPAVAGQYITGLGPDGLFVTSAVDVSAITPNLPDTIWNYYYLTTVAGSSNMTVAGASFVASDAAPGGGKYITIKGAGGYEQNTYAGRITAVLDATHITVTPAPTLSLPANYPTIVYYGTDQSDQINAAFALGALNWRGSRLRGGLYLAAKPIKCPVPNWNNINIPPPTCNGDPGNNIIAVGDMAASTPEPGVLFTLGGYANAADFTQFARNPVTSGIVLDCNFLCAKGFSAPFQQVINAHDMQVKNFLQTGYQLGAATAPGVSGGSMLDKLHTTRDIYYIPVTNITCSAGQPQVTTLADHGLPSTYPYRIVTIVGANSIPQPGPITFMASATGPRTLALRGSASCASWPAYTGGASLAITFPSNVIIHQVFGVTNASPPVVTISYGDLNYQTGQTWCFYGIGGTGTNAPDGCYPTTLVATGGDGAYQISINGLPAGFTFTGGGIAHRQQGMDRDIAVDISDAADINLTTGDFNGVRYGVVARSNGADGKFSFTHTWNNAEQGWMLAGYVLSQNTTLTGAQCDAPVVFCAQYTGWGNTATASLNGAGFPWIIDGASWIYRLDNGASVAVSGGSIKGGSPTLRVSELSNYATRGNPGFSSSIFNYTRIGLHSPNWVNTLYVMPDTVPGAFAVGGQLSAASALITGAASVSGTLSVAGASSVGGLMSANSLGVAGVASFVAPSNCGSLTGVTKCLAITNPNGNTMYVPAWGTY